LFYNVRLSAAYPLQILALWNGGIGYGSVLGCTGFCLIPRCIALRGYVDLVSRDCIAGWAQNVEHPEAPICLDIYAGGELIGRTLANRYREDLEHAGRIHAERPAHRLHSIVSAVASANLSQRSIPSEVIRVNRPPGNKSPSRNEVAFMELLTR
jgi:hypothetical protein